MKKFIPQLVLLSIFLILFLSGCIIVKHVLQLPFRATNDALHENEAFINLDFLIPAGTHINEQMTIGQVMKIRLDKKTSPFEKMLHSLSQLISPQYRYLANVLLFCFWSFLFMTFLRVFTFMGYGRSIRLSFVIGAFVYYFMPDFSPGSYDDIFFILVALSIIGIRVYIRRKKRRRIFKS